MGSAVSLSALNTYAATGYVAVTAMLRCPKTTNMFQFENDPRGVIDTSQYGVASTKLSIGGKDDKKLSSDSQTIAKGRFEYDNFTSVQASVVGLPPGFEAFAASAVVTADGDEEEDEEEKTYLLVRMPPFCQEEVRGNGCLW